MPKGLVVAGTRSGCGKTSASLGLMAALRRRGLVVQPFKAGPDFIDPSHHVLAAGRESHNLDGWMCGRAEVEMILARHGADADVIVVEGVMGLFDGFSATREAGSTAELAKWLGLPVLLVADARSMARSAAALISGYLRFDPGLNFAGVALNNVGSASHAALLAEALGAVPEARLLGCLPRQGRIETPSRHLGLVMGGERAPGVENAPRLDSLADWIESALDLDVLLAGLPEMTLSPPAPAPPPRHRARIGVARDAAFCFVYAENLRRLAEAGAEIVPFSPLADPVLPHGLDGLYLPGGYPELHAERLGRNAGMLADIRGFCDSGRPVYAECGGFMYLMESLAVGSGEASSLWPMAGIFPFSARMGERFAALGYRGVTTAAQSPLGSAGSAARGHEFHYSSLPEEAYAHAGLYRLEGRTGPLPRPEGFRRRNVVASYVHLHFGSNPALAPSFVAACAAACASVHESGGRP